MSIRIVTDSTCDLPVETAKKYGIVVVPAYVNIGNESYLDGVELSREDFYKGLPKYTNHPTTAAPAPGAFEKVYRSLAEEGAKEILSMHIAGNLSGILNAARIGAEAVSEATVKTLDSRQLTMGLGLLTMAAANAAAAGRSLTEIISFVESRIPRTFVFGLLDTLEYLRRSGRVGWAEFNIGTLLKIKPLVQVHMGEVEMLERVRTTTRALTRMIDLVANLGPLEAISLLHIQGNGRLRDFEEQSRRIFINDVTPLTSELTPALGAHIGPGGLGIACITANDA